MAQKALRDLRDSQELSTNSEEMLSTAEQLPPLYTPVVNSLHFPITWILAKIRGFNTNDLQREHPKGVFIGTALTEIVSLFKLSTLLSGFTNDNPNAARRSRPLVVLLHLSTEGRHQLKTLFTGFIEATLLFVLTFFFAAQWGGNLFITTWALGLLLLFVSVGRAVGIAYVAYSGKVWGLHVINCNESDEIRGCLRILCSMENVLVTVNGAHYFDGYRLDFLGKRFRDWKIAYDKGVYDGNEEDFDGKANGQPTTKEDEKFDHNVDVWPVYSSSQEDPRLRNGFARSDIETVPRETQWTPPNVSPISTGIQSV
jgi:hypothetical protein